MAVSNRAVTLAGVLLWAMLAASFATGRELILHHLRLLTKAAVLGGVAWRIVPFAVIFVSASWTLRRLIPRLRQSGEGLEFFLGLVLSGNVALCVVLDLLAHTSMSLPIAPRIAVAIGINAIAAATAFSIGKLITTRDKEPLPFGWGLRPWVFVLPAIAVLFYLHERIHHPWTQFTARVLVPYLGIPALGVPLLLVFLKRPDRLSACVFLTVAAVALIPPVPALVRWNRERGFGIEAGGGIQKVILLTVDTLRYDMIFRPEGSEELAPNLRRILKEGAAFSNAVSPAPWTLTSFCSMMTGLEPLVHGRTRSTRRLPPEIKTLAEYFQDGGYLTRAMLFNYNLRPAFGLDQGFDQHVFADADYVETSCRMMARRLWGGNIRVDFPGDPTSEITRLGLQAIEDLRDKRYFLWIHYLDPHVPYSPPPRFLPPSELSPYGGTFDVKTSPWRSPQYFNPARKKWVRSLYEAEVRYVDESVGRLLEALRETGQEDEVLIVLTSDHGEEFWDHNGFGHGHTLHQELLHVPLGLRFPGRIPSRAIASRVAVPQVMPTILDLCGMARKPSKLDYPSLLPFLDDDAATSGTAPRIWAGSMLYGEPQRALIEGGMKLIVRGENTLELYDMSADPGESANLALSQPEQAAAMFARLKEHETEAAARRAALGLPNDEEPDVLTPDVIKGLKDLGYM